MDAISCGTEALPALREMADRKAGGCEMSTDGVARAPIIINRATTLIATDCIFCGVLFALPERLQAERRKDHENFYCPNGHGQRFSQNETERQLEAERKENARIKSLLLSERATVERLAIDLMDNAKELKRVKKRAEATMCLQCKRTFATSRMQRHIAIKHGVTS